MVTAAAGIAATTRAITGHRIQAEAARAPRRLAQWRLRMLDRLLDDIERLRLAGERTLPDEVSTMIGAFARAHDSALLQHLGSGPPNDLDLAHDAVFDAQGRVMLELASFRFWPRRDDGEALFQDDAEAA